MIIITGTVGDLLVTCGPVDDLVLQIRVSDDFGFQMNLWFRVQAEALILCSERHSQPVVSASFAS